MIAFKVQNSSKFAANFLKSSQNFVSRASTSKSVFESAEKRRSERNTRDEFAKNHKQSRPAYAYLILSIPVATLGLGWWQVRRREWKLNLIEDIETRMHRTLVGLEDILPITHDDEYRQVKVTGKFDHAREIVIKPRTLVDMNDNVDRTQLSLYAAQMYGRAAGGGGISSNPAINGAFIVTPFQLADSKTWILVNRGWTPKTRQNAALRQKGQIESTVTFNADNVPEQDIYIYRDIEAMAASRDTSNVLIDADIYSTVDGGPVGGQTRVQLRNEHLTYILTWWSLSLCTGVMWIRRYLWRR